MIKLFVLRTVVAVAVHCILATLCVAQRGSEGSGRPVLAKAILHGRWIQRSYIDDLEKTKSPYRSYKRESGDNTIVQIVIDTTEIKGDSLSVWAMDLHEGLSFILHFREGRKATSLPTDITDEVVAGNYHELSYSASNGDTSLIIHKYSASGKHLHSTKYFKSGTNSESAFHHAAGAAVFAGSYAVTDRTGNVSTAIFTENGEILGLTKYTRYDVVTDFAATMSRLDIVCFQHETSVCKYFVFKHRDNATFLYEVDGEYAEGRLKVGRLMYTLVRKRSK